MERHDVADDGASWLEAATHAVVSLLADGEPRSAAKLREALPELTGTMTADLDRSTAGPSRSPRAC